eukprot:21552_1
MCCKRRLSKWRDCYINCIGNACKASMHCPTGNNRNCIVNCLGRQACIYSKIMTYDDYGNVVVYANGQNSLWYTVIDCPLHAVCNVSCSGNEACIRSEFNANTGGINENGTLNIVVLNGTDVLRDSSIVCPKSVRPGNTQQCNIDIRHDSSNAISNTIFYAVESFYDISLTCGTSLCYDGTTPPRMYCNVNYNSSCQFISSENNDVWHCINDQDVCNTIGFPSSDPTLSPTAEPTAQPTTISPPTLSPIISDLSARAVYVRSNGCDIGNCDSDNGNFERYCVDNKLFDHYHDTYLQCCNDELLKSRSPTMEPTIEPTTFSPTTYVPTLSPTMYTSFNSTKCKRVHENTPSWEPNRDYCYNIDMHPSKTEYTQLTVLLQNDDYISNHDVNFFFHVNFTMIGETCYDPHIMFMYERTANGHGDTDETFSVYNNNGVLITTCYTNGVACNLFDDCITDNSDVIDDVEYITNGETYRVTLELPLLARARSVCPPYPYAVNAQLTMRCSPPPETLPPTTLIPTMAPNVYIESTCKTVEYAWERLNDEYDGNGILHLGDGYWTFAHVLYIKNKQLNIEGDGYNSTSLHHIVANGSQLIDCHWLNGYLSIADIEYSPTEANLLAMFRGKKGHKIRFL